MKRFILFVIAILLVVLFVVGGYYAIQDINATQSKNYLIDKYELNKFKVFTIKTTEYIYEEDEDCDSLKFKKCTDDKNLYKKVIFKYKNKEIKVYEYNDGTFSDNYED